MTQINIFYNIKASRRPSSVGRAHGSYPYGHRFNPYGRYSNLKKVAFFLPFASFIKLYFLSIWQFYQAIFFVRLTVLSGYIFCPFASFIRPYFLSFDSFIRLYFLPFDSFIRVYFLPFDSFIRLCFLSVCQPKVLSI